LRAWYKKFLRETSIKNKVYSDLRPCSGTLCAGGTGTAWNLHVQCFPPPPPPPPPPARTAPCPAAPDCAGVAPAAGASCARNLVREYLAEEMKVFGTFAAPELPVNHTNLVVSLDKRVLSLYRLETARRVVDDVDVEVVVVILTEPEVARADYRNGQAELTLEWDQVQWARARVTFDHC
jgi:hypothetical protein